ncbi:hypothetical protein ZIOFF_062354 [Zingiber officinale]|uniref:Uncharacterized protein n=1 Tax=Zingiber officinale TaxID=94328 RepID=A0A8J5F5A3_ZINOF|nr:hypothetical protein ZIOFF_062354 [Zingiber officinale]
MSAATVVRGEERWRHFDNSVNAVSFGFVATAVLISMFLVMAIFERFLRSRSPLAENGRGGGGDADFGRRMWSSLDPEVHASKMEYSSSKHTDFHRVSCSHSRSCSLAAFSRELLAHRKPETAEASESSEHEFHLANLNSLVSGSHLDYLVMSDIVYSSLYGLRRSMLLPLLLSRQQRGSFLKH